MLAHGGAVIPGREQRDPEIGGERLDPGLPGGHPPAAVVDEAAVRQVLGAGPATYPLACLDDQRVDVGLGGAVAARNPASPAPTTTTSQLRSRLIVPHLSAPGLVTSHHHARVRHCQAALGGAGHRLTDRRRLPEQA